MTIIHYVTFIDIILFCINELLLIQLRIKEYQ